MNWKNVVMQFLNNCFNFTHSEKESELQNIYNKIDKLSKLDDCIYINSSQGLTEEEILKVLQNEIFGGR